MGLLLAFLDDGSSGCVPEPSPVPGASYWLWETGGRIVLEDCSGFWETEDSAPVVTPPPAADRPTGGWTVSAWERYKTPDDIRRDREDERRRLDLTAPEQRKLDRVAVKIARRVAREGLTADQAVVIAAPAFDAVLTALRPTEGQVLALADAILERVVWMAEMERRDEEAALMALLMEL